MAHPPGPGILLEIDDVAEVIAHRGANREARENSLEAFRLALDAGADGIELDVQSSAGGTPVVHHDGHREVDGETIRLADLPAAELQRRFEIPSLADVLAAVGGRCRLYIELKDGAALEQVVSLTRGRESWCALHSFDHRLAARAGSVNPSVSTGILLVSRLVDTAGAMRAAGARDVWPRWEFIDAELVTEVHGAGGRVIAWTVNDVSVARRLQSIGVDGVCTDLPRDLVAAIHDSSRRP